MGPRQPARACSNRSHALGCIHFSQALRVVRVGVFASGSAGAGSRAGIAHTTTLSVVGLGSTRSRGSRSRRARRRGRRRRRARRARGAAAVGRADVAELDVGVGDSCGGAGLNIGGFARAGRAGAAGSTRCRGGVVRRVGRVKPEHVDRVVVPDGENENHASTAEGSTHSTETTLALERRSIAVGPSGRRSRAR